MKKKLIVACIAGLMSGGLFGAGAERKAEAAKGQNGIDFNAIALIAQDNPFWFTKGMDLNVTDRNGQTLLMLAAKRNKKTDIVKQLLSEEIRLSTGQKININARDAKGENALDYALLNWSSSSAQDKNNAIQIMKLLLEAGVDPLKNAYNQDSPLVYIKRFANRQPEMKELLQWMVEHGYAPSNQAPGGPKIAQ